MDNSIDRVSPSGASAIGPDLRDQQATNNRAAIAPQAISFLQQLQQRQSHKTAASPQPELEDTDDDTTSDDGGWTDEDDEDDVDDEKAEDALAAARLAQQARATALGAK